MPALKDTLLCANNIYYNPMDGNFICSSLAYYPLRKRMPPQRSWISLSPNVLQRRKFAYVAVYIRNDTESRATNSSVMTLLIYITCLIIIITAREVSTGTAIANILTFIRHRGDKVCHRAK